MRGQRLNWIGIIGLSAMLGACGGSGTSSSGTAFRSISIIPNRISLRPSESIQLTAVVDGDAQPVVWSVENLPTSAAPPAETITSGGVLTASNRSATGQVRVSLRSDPTKFGTAPYTVDSGYRVNVTGPGGGERIRVPRRGTVALRATVSGGGPQGVTWTTTGGSITDSGVLTGPDRTGTIQVSAISTADPGQSKTVDVEVVEPIELVNAGARRLAIPSATYPFKARVNGVESSQVTWTASGGTIDASGKWTAPSAEGVYTITGTSQVDPAQSVSAQIEVVENVQVSFDFGSKTILLALRPDKAPRHCANLVSLVNAGFYENVVVHRREPGFVVQWGCPFTKTLPLSDSRIGTGGPGYTIDFEPNDLNHGRYALGMARSASLNSAGSQIYIMLDPAPSLDRNYVVFGSFIGDETNLDTLQIGDRIRSVTLIKP